ncbi:MAG: hypothetical protein K9J17_14350 [Flavobacteriales bacterium]|nr:hypothetical protein [Flavobacteriales bacterium]
MDCGNGTCRNGECECFDGYYGDACQYETAAGPGYSCVSGSCVSVSSNADYLTYSDCYNSCGGSGYTCVSGSCVSVSSNADYLSYSDCYNSCASSCSYDVWSGGGTCSQQGYVPVSTTACCPVDYPYHCSETGLCYSTCEAADAACSSATVVLGSNGQGGSGYVCSGGNCTYVSSGATYSSLSQCQSACSGGGSAGYTCSGGSCVYVSSGASYSTLSACESNCNAAVKGKFVAWTSVSEYGFPNGYNAMNMSVMGLTGTIYGGHYTSEPACNSTYCFTGELYPGTYQINGIIYFLTGLDGITPSPYSVSRTVTIYAGQCTAVHFQ